MGFTDRLHHRAARAFWHFTPGADLYVVDMVGVLTLRGCGDPDGGDGGGAVRARPSPAELSSMKMREEIDALKVIGLDPVGSCGAVSSR